MPLSKEKKWKKEKKVKKKGYPAFIPSGQRQQTEVLPASFVSLCASLVLSPLTSVDDYTLPHV